MFLRLLVPSSSPVCTIQDDGRHRNHGPDALLRSSNCNPGPWPMPSTQAAILTFPAESYEAAEHIAGRLAKAGFEPTSIYIDRSGQDHEVALHVRSADRSRAHRAVYGGRYVASLALAAGLTMVGAALWMMRPRGGLALRGGSPQHAPKRRRGTAQFTTMHLTADQAIPDHPDGFLVLNGDADVPRPRS